MAQFTVRNLEDDVNARLKRRAAAHGTSLEEEVRAILRNAVSEAGTPALRLGSRITARFEGAGLEADIVELRGRPVATPWTAGRSARARKR